MDGSSPYMFKLFNQLMRSHMAVGTRTSAPTGGTSATSNDGSSGAHDSLRTPATDISCGEKAPLAGQCSYL